MPDPDQDPNTPQTQPTEQPAANATPAPAGTPPPAAPAPPPAPAPAPKMFTQEQLNEVAAKARREGRESVLRDKPAESTPQQPPPKPSGNGSGGNGASGAPAVSDDVSRLRLELDEMKQRNVFDKHVAKFALDESRLSDLFDLYKVKNPSDPADWIATKVKDYGWTMQPQQTPAPAAVSTPTPAPTPTPTPTEPAPAKPPAAAPHAPQTHPLPTTMGIVDPFSLTPVQFMQVVNNGELRSTWEKIRQVGQKQSDEALKKRYHTPMHRPLIEIKN